MNPQMTRLYEAAKQVKSITTQSELARALDTSPQTVNNWEARGISKKAMVHIQAALGISASWLETGQGEKFVHVKSNVAPAQIGTKQIPLISYVRAGHWAGIGDSLQANDAHEWLMTDLDVSDGAFALEIKGDSMLPEFNPGDRVIIDPNVKPRPGDYVVAKNGEEEATFKKYRLRSVNEQGVEVFELLPLNPDYPSMRSDEVPIRIVGTMVEVRKYRRTR